MNTELIFIMDRSGSMEAIRKDAIGGVNNLLADQEKTPGDVVVSMALFNNHYDMLYRREHLADVKKLTEAAYVPRGGTALLDAIGRTLTEEGQRIAREKWAELVVVIITTDGQDNMSTIYSRAHVRTMITHAEEHGWKFIFLAANQDAFGAAHSMGMSAMYARNFAATSVGTQTAYQTASVATTQLRTAAPARPLVDSTQTGAALRQMDHIHGVTHSPSWGSAYAEAQAIGKGAS